MEEDKNIVDYSEQDIYNYFGAGNDLWEADRIDLLGIIGGMSGILELIWHKEITPEASFRDFKNWLKETQPIEVEEVEDEG
jgi:hypothetical protein